MKELTFIFSFTIAPENEETYQKMLAETLEITKDEEGTLTYEILKDENGVYCQYERYTDEAACIQHTQNTQVQLQQWMEITKVRQIITLGQVSDDFKEQFQLKEHYRSFKGVGK